MSWDFWKELALAPTATDLQVTVVEGTVAQVVGCVDGVPVSCGSLVVPLNFLVVGNAPFGAILRSPTLKSLRANLGYGRKQIKLVVWKRELLLPLFS